MGSELAEGGAKTGQIDDGIMTPELFVSLMNQFYHKGWMVGSSGGMAVEQDNLIYYSPSSVQKERLHGCDLFVFDNEKLTLIRRPDNPKIKESACTPLFNHVLNSVAGSHCVIHTHSKWANLITMLTNGREFVISHQEMIKGVFNPQSWKAYSYDDRLVIPIIENKPTEDQLLPALVDMLMDYKEAPAVLVRHHGLFVWGPTWEKTKIMTECLEHLFELSCEMIKHGIPLDSEHLSREGNVSVEK
uniref:Aldolase_II domain-containing protein n=1 Tax=Steinernema glaseri TaxID=37863 RepID=A0A1I8A1P5_9BILA